MPIVRNYEEEVVSVRIEMFDAASGQSVWSNRAEARLSGSRAKQQDAVRRPSSGRWPIIRRAECGKWLRAERRRRA